jgi:hypothetical protein
VILISNLVLTVSDGSTIASTEIYGADKKTYINIGSGNVFKLTWKTDPETAPVFTNDTVDYYNLVIKRFDPTLSVYYDIFDKNVGLINEFYVNSEMLPSIPLQYMLSIYVVAYGKGGNVITSNVANAYVCKGSGAYVKVTEGAQQIMKRALAFAKVVTVLKTEEGLKLQDIEGNTLVTIGTTDGTITVESELTDLSGDVLLDPAGNELFANATKLLNTTSGWEVVQESYTRGSDNMWHFNDIRYEMLIATDGKPIEVLVGKDTTGNSIYEPLYVL